MRSFTNTSRLRGSAVSPSSTIERLHSNDCLLCSGRGNLSGLLCHSSHILFVSCLGLEMRSRHSFTPLLECRGERMWWEGRSRHSTHCLGLDDAFRRYRDVLALSHLVATTSEKVVHKACHNVRSIERRRLERCLCAFIFVWRHGDPSEALVVARSAYKSGAPLECLACQVVQYIELTKFLCESKTLVTLARCGEFHAALTADEALWSHGTLTFGPVTDTASVA